MEHDNYKSLSWVKLEIRHVSCIKLSKYIYNLPGDQSALYW